MTAAQPRMIRRKDPTKIEIEWVDGETTVLSTPELRGICPCAQCVNELTGKRMHDPQSVPDDLTHSDVRLVGNYAVTIQFSDGHNTGIFPFQYLRDHDPQA